MKKKVLSLLLAIMTLTLSACGQTPVEDTTAKIEEGSSKKIEDREIAKQSTTVVETKSVQKAKEPRIGMSESDIQNTELGKATDIEKCLDFDMLDNNHKWKKYTWDFGGGKKLKATIYYDNGYGEVVSIEKYPQDQYGKTISSYWE